MKRFLILIPLVFGLVGCKGVGTEEFSTIGLAEKKAPVSFDKAFSPSPKEHLTLSYTAPIGENGQKCWLLFFEPKIPARGRGTDKRFASYTGTDGPVTLVIVGPDKVRKKAWSVLCSVSLGMTDKFRKRKIELRWLEPEKQRGLTLIREKIGDFVYDTELICFPSGLNQQKVVRQLFTNGEGRDGKTVHQFYSVDKKGFLVVTAVVTHYNNPPANDTSENKYHFWNGNGWD